MTASFHFCGTEIQETCITRLAKSGSTKLYSVLHFILYLRLFVTAGGVSGRTASGSINSGIFRRYFQHAHLIPTVGVGKRGSY